MASELPPRPLSFPKCVNPALRLVLILPSLVPLLLAAGKVEPDLTFETTQRMREATPDWIKTHFPGSWLSDRNATSQHLAVFLGWQSENFDFVQLTQWSLQHHAALLCDLHC